MFTSRKPAIGELGALGGLWRQHPRYRGCVGHWFLNEGSGLVAHDLSGQGNDGILTNMAPATAWVTGSEGAVLDFAGFNDHVVLTGTGEGNDAILTMSAWVITSVETADAFIISEGNTGDGVPIVGIETRNTTAGFFIRNGTLTRAEGTTTITDGILHHIVGVADGVNATIYIDGVSEDAPTINAGAIVTDTLAIGAVIRAGSLVAFEGVISDVRLYNRAMSVQEIRTLYDDPYREFTWAQRRLSLLRISAPTGGPTTISIADTAAGIDASGIIATAGVVDTGVGADTSIPAATLGIQDTSQSSDVVSLSNLLSVLISALGTDVLSLPTVTLHIDDSGLGADTLSVDIGTILKTVTDDAIGADALANLEASILQDDAAIASDIPSVDTGAGLWTQKDVQTKDWNGASTFFDIDLAAGDLCVVGWANLNTADAPMLHVRSDQEAGDGDFVLKPYTGTDGDIGWAYLFATVTGTHRVTLTPTDPIAASNVASYISAIDLAGESVVYDTGVGDDKEKEVGGTHSSHTSTTVTPSGNDALILCCGEYGSSPVADSGPDRNAIQSLSVFYEDILTTAAATDFTTTFTNGNLFTVSKTIAFYVEGVTIKTVTEAGSGAEALALSATAGILDTGTGTDSSSPDAALGVTESGAGADALVLTTLLTILATALGADSITSPTVTLEVVDSGTVDDLPVSVDTGAILKAVAEVAIGAEALLAAATLLVSDVGTGVTTPTIAVSITLPDVGVGVDTLDVNQAGIIKAVSDTASALDLLVVAPGTFTVTTLATGQEALSLNVSLAVPDVAIGIDAPTVSLNIAIQDAGSGAETVALISIVVPVTEMATGVDIVTGIVASLLQTDLATATDVVVRLTPGVIAGVTFTLSGRAVTFTLTQRTT